MKVALFYFLPRLGAGSTTFTAQLHWALRTAGAEPTVYRVTDTPQPGERSFGDYRGVTYRVIAAPEAKAIVRSMPSVMTAATKPPHVRDGVIEDLLALGMRAVIHHDKDAGDFDWSAATRPICVREALTALVPGSVYLPHPYVRSTRPGLPKVRRAVSSARIAASKRTSLVLEANRLLGDDNKIELLGIEDRMYSKGLKAAYPEFARSPRAGEYHLDFDSAVCELRGAELNVDMSYFKNDGGGTQYTQLESMDAGCVSVMHEDWFRFPGELKKGVHALVVTGPTELAEVVRGADVAGIMTNCEQLLLEHSAPKVGRMYLEELTRS